MTDRSMLLLKNATLDDGSRVDVGLTGGRIRSVEPAGVVTPEAMTGTGIETEVRDLQGRLLLPAPVEPHAHLDKALTVDVVANPAGDLDGAIEAWLAHRPTITREDYRARAMRAAAMLADNGCTAIRTHVDLGIDIGTAGVEALLEVKQELSSTIELQLVGLLAGMTGPWAGENLAVLRDALELGLDVVGGVPHIEEDPAKAIDLALELAAQYDRPLDLHVDENLDPTSADLETLASRVLATGFEPAVTASHCVALAMMAESDQRRVAELVAEAGIGVVVLPQTNLYLQARDHAVAPPRGLTALAALHRAGAVVGAGADNLRDPFCVVGRADPLETASLLVMAGHLSPAAAYRHVSNGSRAAMGLRPVTIEPGAPADLLAIAAGSIGEAVAAAPWDRVVIRAGRIIGS